MAIPFAIQKALVAKLTTPLAALSPAVPVFDAVPQGQEMPYLEIGAFNGQNNDLFASEHLTTYIVQLHAWTGYRGQRQAHEINAAVYAALQEQPLDLEEGACVYARVERQTADLDSDGVSTVGTTYLTILVQH